MNYLRYKFILLSIFGALLFVGCSSSSSSDDDMGTIPEPPTTPTPPTTATNDMDFWLTKADRSVELKKQADVLSFGTAPNSFVNITVDDSEKYQTIDGFGFTLTGGSAKVINELNASTKATLLQELFGTNANSISINYLRISVGASDLNDAPFTYDEVAPGETDMDLSKFSLAKDAGVISLLKEILAINPQLKIMASPWTAPTWMKDNQAFVGGSLQPKYYGVYAQYWIKYLKEMKVQGITIDALTPQNEPLYGGNNPSMVMTAGEQAEFIKTNLGPTLKTENIATKIVIYDHNCDQPQYPLTVLSDAAANAFVDGSAFHLYGGEISTLSTVHNAFPNKNVYFTEQYNSSNEGFASTLKWHMKNVIIGSMRNWSRNALEWNLANDATFGPHTDGGCTICKGAITIGPSTSVTRNVGYYIVGHASKFVPTGSTRIASNISGDLHSVAFLRPDGKKVLLVENDGNTNLPFNIKYKGKWVVAFLDAGSVGTYIWE